MTEEEVVAAALSDPDAQPLAAECLARMRRVSRVKAAATNWPPRATAKRP